MEAELIEGFTSKIDAASERVVDNSISGDPVESKTPSSEGTPIAPITPIPTKESRDIRAPRPVVPCRLSNIEPDTRKEPECCSSPRTPKRGFFDPFAPGPDDMLLAPKLKKTAGLSLTGVARQLDFCSSNSGKSRGIIGKISDEEKLLDSVYCDILNVSAPHSFQRGKAAPAADSDGFKTPPRFDGIAKTCPDAPMKQGRAVSKRFHIDARLCRKLEF